MTADERIEGLLNVFGQTISDLPNVINYYKRPTYRLVRSIRAAKDYVEDWFDPDNAEDFYEVALPSYICHLCDVIDRMEAALETAKRWMPCNMCEHLGSSCDEHSDECTFWIRDKKLRDYDIGGNWNACYE